MSSLPTTESIPTFITARIAARPRVIPLYVTPILNQPRRILSIHHVLPAKPYARAERNGLESPASTAVSSGSSTESGATANVGALLSEPRLILIPPPNANVTVKSSGWHAASAKEYHKFARKAVDMYLNHKVNLSSQDSAALERAREHLPTLLSGTTFTVFPLWSMDFPAGQSRRLTSTTVIYRVFFQRHRNLPMNPALFVHGDLIIMRVGKLNTANVVNTQAGDPELTAAADDHSFVRKERDSIVFFDSIQRQPVENFIILTYTIESHSNNDFLLGNQHLIIATLSFTKRVLERQRST
ncbi:hypothetical protein F5050DRAFT_1716399 [Lentinula boryana]|uniref:Uncharacterized protein n=1 Tax=Lentinula boryana TaxID=40481 RepID=A0ABQ8PXG6_9AGAR|nr:hypothetical protein F5050DRAFT_1716399 [Lentinula boryana]